VAGVLRGDSYSLQVNHCDLGPATALAVGSMLFTLGLLVRRHLVVWVCSVLGYFLVSLPVSNLAYWGLYLAGAELRNTSLRVTV
jgi:hypothetical protein